MKIKLIKITGLLLALAAAGAFATAAAAGAFATAPVQIPQTGQTTSYAPGDDGAQRKGMAGTNASGRFVVGTNAESNCITDRQTGLMWPKNALIGFKSTSTGAPIAQPNYTNTNASLNKLSWSDASTAVSNMNSAASKLCGYSDWRLPNSNELRSLVNYGESNPATWLNTQGFSNFKTAVGGDTMYYWSSTTYAKDAAYAWGLATNFGAMSRKLNKVTGDYNGWLPYVLPVRGLNPSPSPVPTPTPTVAKILSGYIELDAIGSAQAAISGSAYKNYNMILLAEFASTDVSSSIPSGYYDMVKTILQNENAGTINLLSFGGQYTEPSAYSNATNFANTVIAQANAYNTRLKSDSISAKIDGIDLDLENEFSSDFINTAAAVIKNAGFKVSIAPQIINYAYSSCTVDGSTIWSCIPSSSPQGQVWYSSGGANNQYAAAISSGNVDYIQAQIYNQMGFTIRYGNTTITPSAPTALAAYATIFSNLKGCNDGGVSCIPSTTKVLIGEPVNKAGAGTSVFTYSGMTYSSALSSITTDIASAGNLLDGVMLWSANVDYYSGYYSAAGASYAGQTSSTLATALNVN